MGFVFANERTLSLADIERMDGVYREQFVQTMYGYSEAARAHETPRACVEAAGFSADTYSIALWDILRDGVVAYEYWVLGAGDGEVFVAGTDPTFVHSVQHRFQAISGDHDAEELADCLARDARRGNRP